MHLSSRAAIGLIALLLTCVPASFVHASFIRGTGAGALRGGDLTDPDNNGDPDNDINYNATFSASEEPQFGGSEGAFNVFDNQVAGGNAKWCCGDGNDFPNNPIWVSATFPTAQTLRSFTVTSGNDSPDRRPRVWEIQGSNDGTNFTTLFSQNDPSTNIWTADNQVIEFVQGVDYPVQTADYTTFRFITTATGLTTGARFQLGEIELFNTVPEPGAASLALLAGVGLLHRRRGRHATNGPAAN